MDHTILLYKILLPALMAFVVGIAVTPIFSHFFYKFNLWKRSSRIDKANTNSKKGGMGADFEQIYNDSEMSTPRIGGVIVWFSVCVVALCASFFSHSFDIAGGRGIGFISRNQTLIPFLSLLLGAGLGLVDDLLQIFGNKKNLLIGIPRRIRIMLVLFVGALQGIWFYSKLGFDHLTIPLTSIDIFLGPFAILFFMFVFLALFSSSVIDGIDGLAAGVLSVVFGAYGIIGIFQDQLNIAAFCFVVMGALLAFLWFNIPPARFYLGETGTLSLTLSLAVIIFLTQTIFEFLVIGLPLVVTSASSLIQIISRRFFKKKVFKVAPLHHHLECIGWSREKIAMRYWIISVFCSVFGIILVVLK